MAALVRDIVTTIKGSLIGTEPRALPQGWVRSDHLVAKPTALSGAARVIDLLGQYDADRISSRPQQADTIALYSDWRVIGQDLWLTMDACDLFGRTDGDDERSQVITARGQAT